MIVDSGYFDWLYDMVCLDRVPDDTSYHYLFMHLHSTQFTWFLSKDENRAADGVSLRSRYYNTYKIRYREDGYLDTPCSMLEMMVALALRCEETIMDNPVYGNRTAQWFWGMVGSLKLSGCSDDAYDQEYVQMRIDKFLNRLYSSDGSGGLFKLRNCPEDLRFVDIWTQMCWYLDNSFT